MVVDGICICWTENAQVACNPHERFVVHLTYKILSIPLSFLRAYMGAFPVNPFEVLLKLDSIFI